MSFNGAGVHTITSDGYPVVYDTDAEETVFNNIIDELSDSLSNTICKDGQSVLTQNIPFNAKKITNLGSADSLKDATNSLTIINHYLSYATSVGGTANAITLATRSSTDFVLSAGLEIVFIPSNANTGAVTIDVNSAGVRDLTKNGTTALAPGDLQSGALYIAMYDGTRFQLVTHHGTEGSWTPSIGGTATYTTQLGRWAQAGRNMTVWGDLVVNVIGTGSTSVISGLPKACANIIDVPITVGIFASLTSSVVWLGGNVNINASTIQLRHLTAAGAAPVATGILGNSSRVCFSATYPVA